MAGHARFSDQGVRLDTPNSPHRSLVHPIVDYVRRAQQGNRHVVLITEIQPRHWRYRILQNQLSRPGMRTATDAIRRNILTCANIQERLDPVPRHAVRPGPPAPGPVGGGSRLRRGSTTVRSV
jgi:hypothetical protein